ncbi:hypothetical protein EHQ12_11240 [Leptospira gomenensis]|uniref:DUF1496 domain-containing protein n=1 Tax=Leptospira gomenensis TaxID=2484974 RepID=A0A5F1YAB2_9LEPT|nr:hypothetical protein [Leptospira gomenensis]TGK33356.1 hypothetical protein EHQ17_11230 [Leptospira gomenensis]TGK37349.1 hypothetical protein EHQ12_11240 [Leptospira gomenensis]TGK40538.1 hypothetical protein EHQ07_18285 [Leptospira gomenensis]TGK56460.1 hypothetical protein EHQ13_14850 [Leptospira gomenensis]
MKRISHFLLKIVFASALFGIPTSVQRAQEAEQAPPKEKMICQKIELIINGQLYDDGHKCVSPEAICYLVEGLSLSCFANPKPIPDPNRKQK